MPGFLGTIGTDLKKGFAPETRPKLLLENKSGENWHVERRTIRKFLDDKIFVDREDFLIVTEGVILNKKDLEIKYGTPGDFETCIVSMFTQNGETFFKEFRGSFSGLLFDKRNNLWLIYTNHIGDKQVFYTQYRNTFLFGSEPGFIFDYCLQNNLPLTLNEEAAYMILTYGFLIENHTLAREIMKLTAGHYLRISDGQIQEIQYHRFTNEANYKLNLNDWIEGIDHHFKKAIKIQFDKDLEYGYKHITTLSGGLDSRMTVWVAHQMGYSEQLNITFSQSNYLDETIAKEIATDLQHTWLFKPLDHGNFLKEIDTVTKITYGGGTYAGLAHGKSMYDLLNFDPYGIAHTGQIGDSIIGTFYKKPVAGIPVRIGDSAYSHSHINLLQTYQFRYIYPNSEIFSLYNRAFLGANQGLLVFQEHTESCSPFTDVDFLQFCYSIPLELRFRHKIYFDWVLKKYPDAGSYLWERTRQRIKPIMEYRTVDIFGRSIQRGEVGKWLLGAIKRRFSIHKINMKSSSYDSTFDMNPFDSWIRNNKSLSDFFNDYFEDNIKLISIKEVNKYCRTIFYEGKVFEKIQVLTFLSAFRRIFFDYSYKTR